MFHLSWFLGYGFGLQPWTRAIAGPWVGSATREWMRPGIYVELAQAMERAGFDYLLIEDTSDVDDMHGGSMEATLRLGYAVPKNDPLPLVPLIAGQTRHVGIVPTVTSTFYPPYLAARLLTTLDHLTDGRVGFNLVTSMSHLSAQNYGLESLPTKDVRYAMANEWVDIVKRLQTSWDEGAVLADVENGIFADHRKVHRLDYKGTYYSCRGPLNTMPGPQRDIPMVQAGNSPAGRDITARFANSMIAVAENVEEMKALREDLHRRLRAFGRDPSTCKILFIASPLVAATDAEAQERARMAEIFRNDPADLERQAYIMSNMTGIDFAAFDMDATLADIRAEFARSGRSNEILSSMDIYFNGPQDRTLKQFMTEGRDMRNYHFDLVGSPETVAARMDEIMQEVGGDGFLINLPTTRVHIAEICDGLAPVLQRRGSIRSGYEGRTFKDNLLAF